MTIQINNRTYVGLAALTFTRASDGTVLNWPLPETFTLATNIEQGVQMTRDGQGKKARAYTYPKGATPELTISYSVMQPELISWMIGNEMASGTFDTTIPKLMQVTKANYDAASVGEPLYGVTADDASCKGSVTRDQLSTPLTRQAFSGFNAATDDSFAIGADGALKFSTNLVTEKAVVTLVVPNTVSGIGLSEVLVGTHEMTALLVDTLNQITIFEAYVVTPNLEGRSLEFGGEGGSEIALFLNNVPGECRAYNIIATELTVPCS